MSTPVIEVERLNLSYGDFHAVRDLSFQVARGELALLKRLLPGGAATELVGNAWNGGVAVTDSLLLLAPTLSWVVVAVALATRLFRWEPRR